jgi:hypothetical protein
MKYIIWVFIIFIAGFISGCRRCYFCYALKGTFICHKGNDSTSFYGETRNSIADSINYYKGNGYTIDTQSIFYAIEDQGAQICVRSQYKGFIAQGDSCSDNINQ